MLWLVLAAAVTANPERVILEACDRQAPTNECVSYLAGYIDAMSALEQLLQTRAYCFPDKMHASHVRESAVRALKGRGELPPHLAVFRAIARQYPCK